MEESMWYVPKYKPCPFCGNPNVSLKVYPKESVADGVKLFRNRYAVLCDYDDGGCGGESGHYLNVREAVDAWNQRRRKWRG